MCEGFAPYRVPVMVECLTHKIPDRLLVDEDQRLGYRLKARLD
jgi:hypothetical protein